MTNSTMKAVVTTQDKRSKPKSPPAPSFTLKDSVSDVQKLYQAFGRGEFTKAEIASTLGISATSGPTAARIFTLKEFGLIISTGDSHKVSESFISLTTSAQGSGAFKRLAFQAVVGSALFKELIDAFHSKLPPQAAVMARLEGQKKFNPDRARTIASVLEESLRFAGVLDANSNIVPPREDDDGGSSVAENERSQVPVPFGRRAEVSKVAQGLTMEIGLKDSRKVIVVYPQDLSSDEAEKVGKVLVATTG